MSANSMSNAAPVITVDGPAASGKGTIAAGVAQALSFNLLDSGSLYRLVALQAVEAGIAPDDAPALAKAAENLQVTFADRQILLEGRDVTDRLRREDISAAASQVAVHAPVRTALVGRLMKQQAALVNVNAIMRVKGGWQGVPEPRRWGGAFGY